MAETITTKRFDPTADNPEEGSCISVRIEPTRGWVSLRLKELWEYRELLYFLAWRDLKIRYKQTLLGAAWAIIQPFLTMLVFSLFLGKLAKVPSDGLPYPIFVYAALVPWTCFANGLTQSSNSLVGSSSLITKIYFPRLTIPISAVFAGVLDFAFAFLVLLLMLFYYRIPVTPNILWLPLFILLTFAVSLGAGLWLSALNVEYRDVRHAVPFLVQFWLLATPIAYPSSLLPPPWRMVCSLNPMAGVVDGFRWAMLGASSGPGVSIAASILAALIMLAGGALYFRRVEKSFADLV